MPVRHGICSRCGGSTWIELDPSHLQCGDCGLGSTVAVLTAHAAAGESSERDAERDAVMRDARDRQRRAFAAATFTPYGLDERWTGPRWVGGHGGSNGRVSRLELAHGARAATGPQLRVSTQLPHLGTVEMELVLVAHGLAMDIGHEAGGVREDVRRALFLGEGTDPLAPWAPLAVEVDGTPHPFRLLAEGDHWVAVGALSTVVLSLRARAWDPAGIGLVAITDTTPYGM